MATIRDRKEKLATVEENNNFSDSPPAPSPLLAVCIYREIVPKQNEIPR